MFFAVLQSMKLRVFLLRNCILRIIFVFQ